ncbi:MAG TPA: S8 family serine peptidase, partial [Polyangiaceae bacterium]|nr:S8 family serine peptidase [Polyangiaceae bacterium]
MINKLMQGLFTSRVVVTASSAVATSALLLSAPQPALAQQGSPHASPPPAQRQPRSVTLITGDRVVVGGEDFEVVNIQRGPGRERVNFAVQRVTPAPAQRAHLLVIPEDAAALVQAGKVDRRLFDISLLIELGYDDAHRITLPFIVAFAPGGTATIVAQPPALTGAVIEKDLSSVNGVAASAAKAGVGRVWSTVLASAAPAGSAARAAVSQPIAKIWLDGLLQPVLDRSVPQIGAPAAWDLGFEGAGVIVGVLDTGIDDTHPDLVDNVLASANFTTEADVDLVGHGTHVASIIAGSGAASGGRYRGVAPAAQLLSGKVCEEFGCLESSIIAGMQWAVADQGAQVVNLSLGGGDTPGLDPIEEAVNTLSSEYGALFVIAAGNSGPDPSSVESPGATSAALTVGAVDHEDVLAFFSSTGYTLDQRIKPDLTAPGVDIVAARATGTELGAVVDEDYVTLSGTSMATPHAAGSVALLLDAHP